MYNCPSCAANGITFELCVRRMECMFHFERGLTKEGACWSCGKCFGIDRDGTLDRLPLPWNADSLPADRTPPVT